MSGDKKNIIIYNTVDGKASVSLYARDGMVWMNQSQIAELFDTSVPNISTHISNILKEKELEPNSVIKDYLTTAADGKQYKVTFYSLDMVPAIGFRVRSKRGTQFRIWANRNLKEYMLKGFVMDDERLKNPDGRPDYFDELLERIRDIRASEKRFYQKLRELFTLSSDYDPTDKATQMFFAETPVPWRAAGLLSNSQEARWLGTSLAPVCHFYAGIVAGYAGTISGRPIRVKEVACSSMGAKKCVFHLFEE